MQISLDRQKQMYERHADEAARELSVLLAEHRDELVALGAERAFETVGVHEYGDRTYRLDDGRLRTEALAELADAIFYLHIGLARKSGELAD